MGTVGGVKAQRIHTYIIYMAFLFFFLKQKPSSALKLENFAKKEKIKPLQLLFLS